MPDIKSVFASEIRRLSRKEVKTALLPLQAQLVSLRKAFMEQKSKIKMLEKRLPVKPKPEKEIVPISGKSVRLSPEWIVKLRQKLGLTQVQFAALLETSNFSVSHWELGKTTPSEAYKRKIAALRGLGKRELSKRLAETASGKTEQPTGTKASKAKSEFGAVSESVTKPMPAVKKKTVTAQVPKSENKITEPARTVRKKVTPASATAEIKPEPQAAAEKTRIKPVKAAKKKTAASATPQTDIPIAGGAAAKVKPESNTP